MTHNQKRLTTIAGIVVMLALSLILVGAGGGDREVVVAAGTLRARLVARATIVAAEGVARVSAPEGQLRRLSARAGDSVREGAVLAVVEAGPARHEVLAPIDGTILRVLAAPGDDLAPGTPLLELARLDRLEARIEIDAADAAHVTVGRDVTLQNLGGGAPLANGMVTRVSPVVGRRTIGASDARMRAEGQVVTAWIPLGSASKLVLGQELEAVLTLPEVAAAATLPHDAILIENGHAVVRLPARLWPEKRRVRLGTSDDTLAELLDLEPGTTVLR